MADQKNNIDLRNLKPRDMQSGDIRIIPVSFDEGRHEYNYAEEVRNALEQAFGKADFISASKIEELIAGEDLKTVEILGKILDVLQKDPSRQKQYEDTRKIYDAAVRRQQNYGALDEYGVVRPKEKRNTRSADYGTGVHRLVELIETGIISNINDYFDSDEWKKDKDLVKAFAFTDKEGKVKGVRKNSIARAKENVSQYVEMKDILGLKDIKLSEQHIAAFVKVGDQIVQIAGTLDQLWNNGVLSDLKTSKSVGTGYGMQIQAYARLLKAAGYNVSEAKILQMPFSKQSKPGFNTVRIVDNSVTDEMLGKAYAVHKAKTPEERVKAIQEAKAGRFHERVGFESKVEQRENEQGYKLTYLNGLPINGVYATKSFTPEQLIAAVKTIPDATERGDLIRKIYSDKKYIKDDSERGFHYEQQNDYVWVGDFWDAVREGLLNVAKSTPGIIVNTDKPNLKYGGVDIDYAYKRMYKYDRNEAFTEDLETQREKQKKIETSLRGGKTQETWERPIYDNNGKIISFQDEISGAPDFASDEEWYQLRVKKNLNEEDMSKMAEMAASRIIRIIDISSRIDNYFKAHNIDGIESEEDIKSYLAKTNPVLYDQYMESKELLPEAAEIIEEYKDSPELKGALLEWITQKIATSSSVPGKSVGEMVDLNDALFSKGGLWHISAMRDIIEEKFNPDALGYYTKYRDMTTGQLLAEQKGMGRDYYYSTFVDPDTEEVNEFLSGDAGYSLTGGKQLVKITGDTIKHKDEFIEDYARDGEEIREVVSKEQRVKDYLTKELESLKYTAEEIDKILDQILPNLDKISSGEAGKMGLDLETYNVVDSSGILTEMQKQFFDDKGLQGVRTALALLGVNTPGLNFNQVSDVFIDQLANEKTGIFKNIELVAETEKRAAEELNDGVTKISNDIRKVEEERGSLGKKTGEILKMSRYGSDIQKYKDIGYETKMTEGWNFPFYDNGMRVMSFTSPEQMQKIANARLSTADFSRKEMVNEDGQKWIDTLIAGKSITNRKELNQWLPDILTKAILAYKDSDNLIFSELIRQFFAEGKVKGEYNKDGEVPDQVRKLLIESSALEAIDKRLSLSENNGKMFVGKSAEFWEDLALLSPTKDEEGNITEKDLKNIEAAKFRIKQQQLQKEEQKLEELNTQTEEEKKVTQEVEKVAQTEEQIKEEKNESLQNNQTLNKLESGDLLDVHATSKTEYKGDGKVSSVLVSDDGKVIANILKNKTEAVDWGKGGLSGFISKNKDLSEEYFKNLVEQTLTSKYDYGYSKKSGALNARGKEELNSIMAKAGFDGYQNKENLLGNINQHVENIDRNTDLIANQHNPETKQILQKIADDISKEGAHSGGSGSGGPRGFKGSPDSKLLNWQRQISGIDVQIADIDKAINKPGVSEEYKKEQERLKGVLTKKRDQLQDEYNSYFEAAEPLLSSDFIDRNNLITDEASARAGIKDAESGMQALQAAEKEYRDLMDKDLKNSIEIWRLQEQKLKAKSQIEKDSIQAQIDELDRQSIDINELMSSADRYQAALEASGLNSGDASSKIREIEIERENKFNNVVLASRTEEAKDEAKKQNSALQAAEKEYKELLRQNVDRLIAIDKLETEALKAKSDAERYAIENQINFEKSERSKVLTSLPGARVEYEKQLAASGMGLQAAQDKAQEFVSKEFVRYDRTRLDEETKRATIPKTDPQTEAKEEYVKLLEKEYDLRLKLEKWKKDYEAQKGTTPYDLVLKEKEAEIALLEKEAQVAGDKYEKLGGSNKNDLLSRYEAEYQLKLDEMTRKAAGGAGSGSQKQSVWNQMGWSKDGLTRTITQFFSLYRILGKVRQTIQKVINITKQLDQAATNIRIVTGQTREEVDNAILSYSKLAQELGTTTVSLANSANTWLRQGYSVAESMDLIAASTKLSKLGMLDMGSATKVLTSTLKGFKMEANEATTIVDKLTKLDMNYAASAGEIGEAMARTSAIASQMGMSLDETAAMVTTIMDVTQQSSEMAGTAVRSILSRYGNVKSGSFLSMMTGDEEDLEKINDIEKVLNVLGISIRTSKMEMRNMGDVLDELALKWNTLSSVEQNAVATAFAGVRQRNFFQVMLSNWDKVREAQEIAANSAGTSEEKYAAYMDSIEAHMNKLTTAWETFTQRLGQSGAIKSFVKTATWLVEHLDKIITHISSLIVAAQAYKMSFSGLMNPLNKFTTFLNTQNIKMAGGAIAGLGGKNGVGITQHGFAKVDNNFQRLISVVNNIAQKIGARQAITNITAPGFLKFGNRVAINRANQTIIKNLKKPPTEDLIDAESHGGGLALVKDRETAKKDLIQKNQLEIDRRTNQNRFNRRWGLGMGYATTDDKGNVVYAARSHGQWIGADGNVIDNKDALANLDAQKKALKSARIKTGVATGAVSGITAFTSGTNSYFGNKGGLFSTKDISINDIQSDFADNLANGVATGAATGLLSAIPGVGPILGPIFGPIIGDGIGGLFKWLRHKDEIDRKQRVEDAKKNLEALNKIESATKGVESAVYDLGTVMAVVEAKKAVDELIKTILDDSNNRENIFEKLSNLNIKNTNDLEKVLLGNDDELKAKVLDVINNYTSGATAEAKFASQEQDRFEAQKKFENTYAKANSTSDTVYRLNKNKFGDYFDTNNNQGTYSSSLKGSTYVEKVENAKAAAEAMRQVLASDKTLTSAEKDYLESEIKKLDAISKEYSNYQATSEKLNRELWSEELASAFSEAKLSLWSTVDVSKASLEEVVQTFANKLELTGQATRDYTGAITDTARTQIETFLRSNERFSALFTGTGKTLNDLIVQQSKQNDLVAKTGKSYEELRDIFDHNNIEAANALVKAAEEQDVAADKLTDAASELRKAVYAADNSELNAYAKALHMTTDQVLEFQKQLGSVTLADILKTPAELRDSMGDLINIFGALSSSAQLSGEMLEKVNGQYFTLYNQYDESGNIISTSAENLLSNLRQRLFGSANDTSTQAFLYQNATFEQFRSSSDFYKGFQKAIEREVENGTLSSLDFDSQKIKDAQTLNDVIDYVGNNNKLSSVLATYLDSLNMQNMYYKELQDKLVEWQKHENQITIDNFKGQIDALEQINDERQKEIDLIKAKEALENAKNEKKRVYRAGVGWTYESDSQAISEAQKELENLETEKEKQNLQYQIDLLQQQNDILDHIAENEQLEALKNIFNEYQSYMKDEFGQEVTNGMSSILDFIGTDRSMTWSEYIRLMGKEKKEEENALKTGFESSLESIRVTGEKMDELGGADGSNIHKKEYIAQQQAQNAAYNDYLSYRKQLINQGYSESDLKELEKQHLGKDIDEITNISNSKLGAYNEQYYYTTGHWNNEGDKVDESGNNYELRPSGKYSTNEINTILKKYKENPSKAAIKIVSGGNASEDQSFTGDISTLPNGTVLFLGGRYKGDTKSWDQRYVRKNGQSWEKLNPVKLMYGTMGLPNNIPALINEIGTEGIVTPEGTLTALPSKTGVVPADLTRNLYDLGEVAPTLVKRLKDGSPLTSNLNGGNQDDHSMNITNFNATFNTIDNYDFEQLLIKARQYISTTKNNRG